MASILTVDDAGGQEGGVTVAQSARALLHALSGSLRSLDLQGLHDVCPVDVLQGAIQILHCDRKRERENRRGFRRE